MNVLTLFGLQILIYAAFPFYLASRKKGVRAAGFYILISIYLVIGGFLGSVYSFPVTETTNISGGNLAYGALMMTTVLFVIIEKDISVLRNTIRLVFWVNVFKVLYFSTISWALQNETVINPNSTSFAVFRTSVFFVILGGALIILELFLFVLIFEQLKKKVQNVYVLAILYTLVFFLVLCLDGVLFPTIAFGFSPQLVNIVIGGVRGKLYLASAYSIPIVLFLIVYRKRFTEYFDLPLIFADLWAAPREKLIEEIRVGRDELVKSEKKYRTLFEESSDGIMVLDEQNNPMDVNKRACEILGYSKDELLLINAASLIHEEDLSSKDHQAAMEKLSRGESIQVEYRLRRKDGEFVPIELSTKILDEGQFLNVIRDIQKRKQAEADIQRHQKELQLFKSVFDASEEAIAISDAEGQLVYINPAHQDLFGHTLEQARQANYRDYYPPESVEILNDIVVPTLERGDSWEGVLDVFGADGTRFPLWERADAIHDEDGNLLFAFGFMHDFSEQIRVEDELRKHRDELEELVDQRTSDLAVQVTESEKLNNALTNLLEDFQAANEILDATGQKLAEANQELEAFTYSVSHDLRAPLRAIDGFSQILLEDYSEQIPEDAVRYLDKISEGALHMGSLIQDLLDLSRLSRKPLQNSLIEPMLIVEHALMVLTQEQEGRNLKIDIHDLPPCKGDLSLIKQVYLNLIGNAFKFTRLEDSPVIEIGWQNGVRETIYFVRDNGVGFDMEFATNLFGVFQRLHPVEQFEGTGVGLAIVQRIIRRHGGRVWAEAELDKGATFYFTIPTEDEL